MLQRTESISAHDKERLIESVDRALSSWLTYAPYLDFFRAKLRRARAVSPVEIPDDMITMHSRFTVKDDRSGESICYTLVFPEEHAELQGKLSVLSPMGMTLFGARVGDEVVWMSAAGPEVATIKKLLYQPEAAEHLGSLRYRTSSMPELFLG